MQTFFGIDWYDSGARFQTTHGTFSSLDPKAESYYPISPYAYCAGDPVNRVDPDGLSIRALGTNSIDAFLNMLSDEALRYIAFDSNGVLNHNLIASYSGNSILMRAILALSSSNVLYDFIFSDNDGEEQFYDIDNKKKPGSYYYGITRYPGAHELLGHGYYYELSRKDPSIKPTHVYKIISGPEELDEETGLLLSPAIRVSDMDAPIEKWIKQIEDTIRDNYDRRKNR